VVGQLTEAGYKTGQSNITGPSGQVIIRVWAGPFSNQKEALRAKGSINKQLGLNGFVSKLQS
jgi:cell division septation protein DedD